MACWSPPNVSTSTLALKVLPSLQLTVVTVNPSARIGNAVAGVSTTLAAKVNTTRFHFAPPTVGRPVLHT
jgi:hypothetical protein